MAGEPLCCCCSCCCCVNGGVDGGEVLLLTCLTGVDVVDAADVVIVVDVATGLGKW